MDSGYLNTYMVLSLLAPFGGSSFSGFIRSQRLLTLLSVGRCHYYGNFTVVTGRKLGSELVQGKNY